MKITIFFRYCLLLTLLPCVSCHSAATEEDTETVKALIAAGANVNKAGEKGVTPLRMATVKGRTGVITLLKAAGAKE